MGENEYIEFPEEYSRRKLNALYREIPLKDATARLLRKYFNAMAVFYGVIRLKKAYEIITDQNPSLITEKEFLAFAEIARHEYEEYYILGRDELFANRKAAAPFDREIIYVPLLDDMEHYCRFLQMQQGKPYRILPKNKLLCYSDPYFYEETLQTAALKEFLTKCFKPSEAQKHALLAFIVQEIRSGDADISGIIDYLDDLGFCFKKESDFNRFAKLYMQLHNATAMPCNRGYSPNELSSMLPPEERIPKSISFGPNMRRAIAEGTMDANELREEIMAMDFPNENLRLGILKEIADAAGASAQPQKAESPQKPPKIGRNDPCPCGSGKKYKNCCGR